jgi:hypothetical protein
LPVHARVPDKDRGVAFGGLLVLSISDSIATANHGRGSNHSCERPGIWHRWQELNPR